MMERLKSWMAPELVGNSPGDAQDWKVGDISLGGPGSLKPNAVYKAFDGRAARERQLLLVKLLP